MKRIIFAALVLFVSSANAGLIKNGSIISDTSTGLDWMELTATTDYTYNQMLGNFNNASSIFYGFEYASLAQVQSLFNSEGYSGNFHDFVSDASSRNAVSQIYDLFGRTGTNCCNRGDGMILSENSDLVDWLFYIPELSRTESLVRVINDRIDPDVVYWDGSNDNRMGSWIVRSSVQRISEPVSLALVGVGLAGLGLFSRKRRKA